MIASVDKEGMGIDRRVVTIDRYEGHPGRDNRTD
jgi:hypothetical protein